MTNALKLAEEIEGRLRSADCHPTLLPEDARLVAAALRLAEAKFALDNHEDDEPTEGLIGEWTRWSEERDVLHRRVVDAAMNYELAREGR